MTTEEQTNRDHAGEAANCRRTRAQADPSRRVLIAIGGNSLIRDQNRQTVADQYEAAADTARRIADVIARGFQVVVTHGNGPQVGFILLRSELSRHAIHEVPLVSCVADTQGAIGYHLQQTLRNALLARGNRADVVTVITQCVVDPDDPSFQNPSKPIGLFYSREDAERARRERGWVMMEDAHRGFRRVVPSPRPIEIIEVPVIRGLMDLGVMVIAAGGGGIPVVRDPDTGALRGVDAVIDKDLASALLANALGVPTFVISTAVPGAYVNFGRRDQRLLKQVTASDLAQYAREGHFAKGSMAPKVEAVLQFLRGGGRRAVITSPEHLEAALDGRTGTQVVPD